MNLIDGLVLLFLFLWGILAARASWKKKRSGKCAGCSGNCGSCGR
ncbi:FeoB-associated Cys-rich membrane protein [Roseburia sp. BX0805]|uniref:FeoB-associated Cys-rich membrane protein n=1 Tax=Roseburia yibonii TaxID=2763063 RepID=A0ABR7I7W3_9FIRM|nr:FeoB-associated Cys-rich membrane protein [Roseburia yibonii]MBC5753038.1 FeoB-associated Cys-rich membrane protein [Roseburia yibonii]MEE0117701.1 FeoB-associated Cys-rich membrane protein [Lachnospiraceae bacterium]CDF41914.1 unknown [Roseburia sp. CAG:182]